MSMQGKTLDLFSPGQTRTDEGSLATARGRTVAVARVSSVSPMPPPVVKRSPAQLWLALHLPHLSLEALGIANQPSRTEPQCPVAVIEVAGSQQRVSACNAVAGAMGIMAGMGVNAAYALAGGLRVHQRDTAREHGLLNRAAEACGRFTPRVSLEPPDALLLEVKGSRRLFGGLTALRQQIVAGLREQGLTAWPALAPTPRAALWAARSGEEIKASSTEAIQGVLAGLPLAVLRWPEGVVALLASMGIHSLADCLRLPRDGFARRLGPERLLELDQALGRAPEVRRDFRPVMRFKVAIDLEEEIEDGRRLGERLDGPLDDLVEFLATRQAGVQALLLVLRHRNQPPTCEIFRFAALATRRQHFMAVLTERLSRMVLAAPVRGIRLHSGALLVNTAISQRFGFAAAPHDHPHAARLLERLRARLGDAALYRVQSVADHRPEQAWRKSEPWDAATGGRVVRPAVITGTAQSRTCRRPEWLLPEPQPLGQEGGWPVYEGPLVFRQGPERIEGGWWDGRDVARDYYVAEARNGSRLWIYRSRRIPHGWFLHGIFG